VTTSYIALGKAGDIISCLPILRHHFVTKKEKPNVLTSRDYASLLDRVPFVNTEIYDGGWMDLEGAMIHAKRKHSKVIPLAVFGSDFPIQHKTSSFQLEAYERSGMLGMWDKLKLEGLAGGEGIQFKKPTILFADHSQSSPFMQKEDLFKLLVSSFPGFHIERLSNHKLPHLFDFLSWYDAAKAVVCVDSAHLHLSAATKKPVAALTQSRPEKWHGSAWSKRFCFYCRYSEYEQRRDELVECLRDKLESVTPLEIVELN